MFPTTPLTPGAQGQEVRKLQEFLVKEGFLTQSQMNTGPGTYGPKTKAAVESWQRAKGVVPKNTADYGYWGPLSISAAQGTQPTQTTPSPQFKTNQPTPQAPQAPTTQPPTNLPSGNLASLLGVPQFGGAGVLTAKQIADKLGITVSQLNQATGRGFSDNQDIDLGWLRDVGNVTFDPSKIAQTPTAQQASQAPQQVAQTPPASQYGLGGEYAQMYDMLKNFLDALTAKGQSINPNIEITPERVSEFMKQAESNIDTFLPYASKEIKPYFENQLKVAREGFLRSAGYTQQQLVEHEAELERRFKETQRQTGEQFADQGFALSGLRKRQEQETADATQRAINQNRQAVSQRTTDLASAFAQNYGTANLPSLQIGETPKVGDVAFSRSGTQVPFYQLSPEVYSGLKGEQQFADDAATRARASELESAFRSQEALNQQRRLTF